MIHYTVFSVVSLLVYFFGMIEGSHEISSRFQIAFLGHTPTGISAELPLKGIDFAVWFMLTLFAFRLYIHAWIVDESKHFQDAIKTQKFAKCIVEWFLRVFWVMAIAFLPTIFSKSCKVFVFLNNLPPFTYMSIIGISLVIWGILMFPVIDSYSTQANKDLKLFWFRFDIAITICWLLLALTSDYQFLTNIFPTNWTLGYQFIALNGIIVMTFIQILYWFHPIHSTASKTKKAL